MKSKQKAKFDKRTSLWSVSERRVLISIGSFFVIVTVISFLVAFLKDNANQNLLRNYENQEIPHNIVCSVGNQIEFANLKKLNINDKTYWVCCDQCKARLENNINLRLAIDPFSKNMINKSNAVIIQNPKAIRKVMYFESMDNFLKYRALKKNI